MCALMLLLLVPLSEIREHLLHRQCGQTSAELRLCMEKGSSPPSSASSLLPQPGCGRGQASFLPWLLTVAAAWPGMHLILPLFLLLSWRHRLRQGGPPLPLLRIWFIARTAFRFFVEGEGNSAVPSHYRTVNYSPLHSTRAHYGCKNVCSKNCVSVRVNPTEIPK